MKLVVALLSLSFISLAALPIRVEPKRGDHGRYFIVGELHDRLGNQLFEIAATLSLAIDHNAEAIFPDLSLRKDEGIPMNREMIFFRLSDALPSDKIRFHYREDLDFHFALPCYHPNMSLTGYFQSEKYFKHNKEKILPLFEPKPEIPAYLQEKYFSLLHHPCSVALHLRDFRAELGVENRIYAEIGRSYIDKAVECFPEEALFVIFSDRIEWAKSLMEGFCRPHIFIEGETYLHDFFLMSYCCHQIISNSTFSWWAAYLNKNPEKKIVAPKDWFHPEYPATSEHIIPQEWLRF